MIALFDEFPAGAHPTKDQYEHFSIGRADERTARRAQAARASTNDDGQTVADTADMDEEEYNDADVELPHQERIGHDVATVHTSTVAFHQKILRELDDGQDEPGGAASVSRMAVDVGGTSRSDGRRSLLRSRVARAAYLLL